MGKDKPGPGPVQINEKRLIEWFEKGFAELGALLASHARFDSWLAEHHREETR